MDELYKEYIISYFDKKLGIHGDRPEALSYSAQGQRLRFEALLDMDTEMRGGKVLDYGCGKGDFYQFLKDKDIQVSYTGFDINKNLLRVARRKYPECTFKVFDIERESLTEDFDYVFLCAVFNLNIEGLDETIRNVLKKLFDHCSRALTFNALSAHDPHKDFQLHYVYPEDMLEFALKHLSPHAVIKQGRIPYDFTLVVNKQLHELA